jgi:hypothetical protein
MSIRTLTAFSLTVALFAGCDRTPPSDKDSDTDTTVPADTDVSDTEDTEDTQDTEDTEDTQDTEDTEDTNPGDTDTTDTDDGGTDGIAIAALRDGTAGVVVGDLFTITDVVVTGIGRNGFTVQEPTATSNGGIYVLTFESNLPSGLMVGDVVDVTGEYAEYRDSDTPPYDTLAEIIVTDSTVGGSITVTSNGATVSPIVITAADVATDEGAEMYESMLVTLDETELLVAAEPDQYNAFYVNAGNGDVLIDDEFVNLTTELADFGAGGSFDAITGVMFFSFGGYKILPRSTADVASWTAPE